MQDYKESYVMDFIELCELCEKYKMRKSATEIKQYT